MPHLRVIACTVAVATCACSGSSKEGVSITVVLEAPSAPPLAGESRVVATDVGYRVVLTRGYLSTGAAEVFACGARMSWRDLFLRDAHAHTTGSPTLLGVPALESLLAAPDTRLVVGDIHPPAGSYCRVRQTIRAADHDAIGLSPSIPMLGKSLLVEGTHARAGEEPSPFTISSSLSVEVESTVPTTNVSADGTRVVQLVLSKAGDHWFDTIDFATSSETDTAPRVLQNIRRSLGARFE